MWRPEAFLWSEGQKRTDRLDVSEMLSRGLSVLVAQAFSASRESQATAFDMQCTRSFISVCFLSEQGKARWKA
jgi:hypothetical protein